MVDNQAKLSLSLEPTSFKIPFSNFKPSINKYILDQWQTSRNNSIGNKLLEIKVSNGAQIRNRYNQVPHLTQDTNGKVTNSQKTPQTRAKRSALSQQVTKKHI